MKTSRYRDIHSRTQKSNNNKIENYNTNNAQTKHYETKILQNSFEGADRDPLAAQGQVQGCDTGWCYVLFLIMLE